MSDTCQEESFKWRAQEKERLFIAKKRQAVIDFKPISVKIFWFLGLFPKVEPLFFDECENNRNTESTTLPFGRLRYEGYRVQSCSWKFDLPDENRDYVFAMQIPFFRKGNTANTVTLPNNGKIAYTLLTRFCEWFC